MYGLVCTYGTAQKQLDTLMRVAGWKNTGAPTMVAGTCKVSYLCQKHQPGLCNQESIPFVLIQPKKLLLMITIKQLSTLGISSIYHTTTMNLLVNPTQFLEASTIIDCKESRHSALCCLHVCNWHLATL